MLFLPRRLDVTSSNIGRRLFPAASAPPSTPSTSCNSVSFSSSTARCQQLRAQKHKYRDPYILAQARQRKAANLARQDVLKKERAAALGDPVHSAPTPFIKSLDRAAMSSPPTRHRPNSRGDLIGPPPKKLTSPSSRFNYLITPNELAESLAYSFSLTEPSPSADSTTADPGEDEERTRMHEINHANAVEAIRRITSLSRASTKERTRVNVQRCIETFGRHKTDAKLAHKAPAIVPRDPSLPPPPEKTPRAGPDTGSSEVQVAVLTTKIRALARHLDGRGRKDKVNKRNLRVLVHKRQKLLHYLRRKERGGPRWEHVMKTLGLADGAWKGEISM
ncbi:MAG: hypothetical protein M1833_002700 [Piccolia ochrophora]|nr:MAG: hypothetical protein M1833_002700 [Piccolia ochrophora]